MAALHRVWIIALKENGDWAQIKVTDGVSVLAIFAREEEANKFLYENKLSDTYKVHEMIITLDKGKQNADSIDSK